jgi:hypothetical protein
LVIFPEIRNQLKEISSLKFLKYKYLLAIMKYISPHQSGSSAATNPTVISAAQFGLLDWLSII